MDQPTTTRPSPTRPSHEPEDAALIDRALAAPWHVLNFPGALEARFRAEGRADGLRYQRLIGLIGIGLFILFIPADAEMIPDVFRQTLGYYAATAVLATLLLALLRAGNPSWLTNIAAMLYTLPGLATQMLLFAATRSPDKAAFLNGTLLIILFTNISMQQRVSWIAAGSLGQIAIVLAGLSTGGISTAAQHAQAATTIGDVMLTLMIAHRFEWRSRRAWLFRARDGLSHASLLALSERDGLTGLANRRAIDKRLEHAWATCAAENEPLAIIMLDVDWFKRFNDHYGHPEGDTCLRAIGGAIADHVRRQGDLAGRYGGEEFILILPATDADTSHAIAERVCDAIEALQIPHCADPTGAFVTASLGVAAAMPAAGGTVATLLAAADAALYEAKRTGRARVACAETVG